jgi:predicted P-loop ATPase
MTIPEIIAELELLPDEWGLVVVDGRKRAYQDDWPNKPLSKEQAAAEIRAGRAKAVGAISGPVSGGLLFVDHDGISATDQLEKLGLPLSDLPRSIAFTSGRDGRFQVSYKVPEEYWQSLRNRKTFYTGKLDDEGKREQLDLRWNGHYSVVIGAHPLTSGYRWLKDRGPSETGVAEAPIGLVELLLHEQRPEPEPLLAIARSVDEPGVIPLLEMVTRGSRDLVEGGGTPGSWNDDQLSLALDLVGTEAWIRAQGHKPDMTARQAFEQHIAAAKVKAKDFDDRKAWRRFEGAAGKSPTPGTPLEQLLSRLAYHTRPIARQRQKPLRRAREEPQPKARQGKQKQVAVEGANGGKPIKLEAAELLLYLRSNAARVPIRWNTFTQSIEVNGKQIEGIERFYLVLAEQQNFKVSKDLAIDCLMQVAYENKYDPVTEYLNRVAEVIEPAYIDALATAYLRPEDAALSEPTLYDAMLKATLIGAVKRAFEPGCKHDTACVLAGDQGARKSSFWSALGGPFFSDSLRDIGSKDDLMVLHRSWIMEWAELDHITNRKHAGQVKAFLSQSSDVFRAPYARGTENFPRRGIIVGSTNRSTGLLVDETGNRRFWIIPTTRTQVEPIDTANLSAERDAIWSAAVHAYRAGGLNYLNAEQEMRVMEENEEYQLENPWMEAVSEWLKRPDSKLDQLTTERILSHAVLKPLERQTRADQMVVAGIMQALGYHHKRSMNAGVRVRVWQETGLL